jgi:excisionase family DNA binding protein
MPTQKPARRYASMANAAEYADCNERTLRRHIATGDITGYRLGRVYRIDLNELDAWLTSNSTGPMPPIKPRHQNQGAA